MRYQYQCDECKKEYGVEMKLEEHGQEVKCPKCGKPMKQAIYAVPFRIR